MPRFEKVALRRTNTYLQGPNGDPAQATRQRVYGEVGPYPQLPRGTLQYQRVHLYNKFSFCVEGKRVIVAKA